MLRRAPVCVNGIRVRTPRDGGIGRVRVKSVTVAALIRRSNPLSPRHPGLARALYA